MCKYYTHIIAIIAVVVAILSLILSVENARYLVVIENFFGVMLPILAVGALFKYLFGCKSSD